MIAAMAVEARPERSEDSLAKRLLSGDKRAVFLDSGFDFHNGSLAMRGGKYFLSRQHPLHRPMRLARY